MTCLSQCLRITLIIGLYAVLSQAAPYPSKGDIQLVKNYGATEGGESGRVVECEWPEDGSDNSWSDLSSSPVTSRSPLLSSPVTSRSPLLPFSESRHDTCDTQGISDAHEQNTIYFVMQRPIPPLDLDTLQHINTLLAQDRQFRRIFHKLTDDFVKCLRLGMISDIESQRLTMGRIISCYSVRAENEDHGALNARVLEYIDRQGDDHLIESFPDDPIDWFLHRLLTDANPEDNRIAWQQAACIYGCNRFDLEQKLKQIKFLAPNTQQRYSKYTDRAHVWAISLAILPALLITHYWILLRTASFLYGVLDISHPEVIVVLLIVIYFLRRQIHNWFIF